MLKTYRFTRHSLWWAVVILILAAWLRLDEPDWGEFQYDQAELSGLALRLVKEGEPPTKGMLNSRGIYHTPAMAYVMALPYSLSDDPQVAMLCIRLWHIWGVAMLYGMIYRFSGQAAAIAGGLAYAVSPWAVLYGVFIWNVTLILPFLIGSLWLALEGFGRGKGWAQAVAIPLFSLVPQIHYSGLTLMPLWLGLLWMGRRNLRWWTIPLGIGLTLVTLIPFVAGLSHADVEDYRTFFLGDGLSSEGSRFSSQAIERGINLTAGLDLENHLVFDSDPTPLLEAVPRPDLLWLSLAVVAGIGALVFLRQALMLGGWVGLWFCLPIIGSLDALRVAAHYHYLMLLLPAAFWLVGVGAAWLYHLLPPNRPLKTVVWAVWLLLLGSQAVWWQQASAYVGEHALGGLGTPYHYLKPIRDHLLTYDDVVIVGAGPNTSTNVWKPLLYEVACVRELIASDSSVAVFPAHRFAVLYPPDGQINALDEQLRSLYIVGHGQLFYLREGETPYRVYDYPQAPTLDVPIIPFEPRWFDMGVQLTGYALMNGNLYLEWHLASPRDEKAFYVYFAHFLNAMGERIGQRDASFWQPRFWCNGDRVVLWTAANPPLETTLLRVGLYAVREDGTIHNQNVLDSGGNPVGQWVDITLP